MSILDNKHILTINLDDRSIKTKSNIRFYNTDRNIANLYIKLEKTNSDEVTVDLNETDLTGLKLKLTVIKPKTNEFREITGVLTRELQEYTCAIYKFELPLEFTDQAGIVYSQFDLTDGLENGENITIDPFSYEVKASRLTGLNAEIIPSPDLPILKQLIEEMKKAQQWITNIDDTKSSEVKTYSSKKIEDIKTDINEQFNTIKSDKASKSEVDVERKRIDSFTSLSQGSTTGDAELIDGRVGVNGVVYANIGNAVRNQINALKENISDIISFKNKVIFSFTKNTKNGYLGKTGLFNDDSSMSCIYTNEIKCAEGDVFLYKGFGTINAVSCLFKNDDKIVGYRQYDSKTSFTEVIIPSSVNKVIFTSFTYSSNVNDVVFELKIKTPTLTERVEVVENLMTHNDELYQIIDCTKTQIQDFETTTHFLYKSNGSIGTDSLSDCTEFVSCSKKDTYYVTGYSQYATCLIATYDTNKKFLRSYGFNPDESRTKFTDFEFIPKEDEVYTRFSSYQTKVIVKKLILVPISEYVTEKLSNAINSNILHGKKYVSCGDSFTEGDFTGFVDDNGLSGKNSPVIYDTNRSMYKTYPWWIAERNGMTLINEAKCGTVLTNAFNGERNPFSVTRYKNVPTDADYITLMFGLNETDLTDEQIGTKTDATNTTLWGAYNIIFEYFLTNMPYAKIGVIIADAWMNTKYANAVKSICTYWGIPVLDLKFDIDVTIGIGGRPDTNSKAQQLRDLAFKVTSSNGHPNVKAHEYRSTVIENWLRSL